LQRRTVERAAFFPADGPGDAGRESLCGGALHQPGGVPGRPPGFA